ncbi:MAG: phosphatase PAP2 family protein [Alicyclobacillus sp.]|nr:phosphatase PAP2 family protein [Alicyclobacillus sp.]
MLVLIALWGLGVLEPGAGPAVNTWTALTALAAATIARVLNEPIARYFSRPRPFEVTVLQPLVAHERGESFPSNHATGGFALAGAFLSHPGAHALLVALALLLSLSRVYTGLHYLTDVLAGAVTGTLVATGVWVTATHGFHLLI